MNLKAIFTIIVLALISYTAVRFFISGQPLTIEAFTNYVIAGTQDTINATTQFLTDKWQVVTATLGTAITGISLLYRSLKSKLTAMQSTATNAQNQVDEIQANMTQQYNTLQATINEQKTQITNLKTEMEANATAMTNLTDTQNLLTAKEQELESARSTIEELKAFISELKLAERVVIQ